MGLKWFWAFFCSSRYHGICQLLLDCYRKKNDETKAIVTWISRHVKHLLLFIVPGWSPIAMFYVWVQYFFGCFLALYFFVGKERLCATTIVADKTMWRLMVGRCNSALWFLGEHVQLQACFVVIKWWCDKICPFAGMLDYYFFGIVTILGIKGFFNVQMRPSVVS